MIEVKSIISKDTGELFVTDDVNSDRFWGRLLRSEDKAKHIKAGLLTAQQTEKIEPHIEPPLTILSPDSVDYTKGIIAPDNFSPVINVIEQPKQKPDESECPETRIRIGNDVLPSIQFGAKDKNVMTLNDKPVETPLVNTGWEDSEQNESEVKDTEPLSMPSVFD